MSETIKIPVSATHTIEDGQIKQVSAEYMDCTADLIARFLLERFGVDAMKGGKGDDND